ncbi:beta-propeller fold lactonase family protein [Mitsuaria sp. GD03876]|uniref:lactonase family protein n=1 Tax=Mitsuaria sp. GD03876 TaxID=2975399 RepID=UPI00244CFA82|nr:beta-propeller fold lactonase family protein [Mitsuaria sp. GD03876]MDH0866364.1 lactonase family protein [Mitsuaria sp. GD03876]
MSSTSFDLTPAATGAAAPFAYAGGYAPHCGGIHALTREVDGRVRARLAAPLDGSPTWLHLADGGRRLHALVEDGHALASFAVDPVDGALTPLSRQATGGTLPVHLAFDEVARQAWIAHYGDGSLRRAAVDDDGALRAPDLTIAPRPGPAPHAHMARLHPSWPLMLASDLGQDLLRVWRVDGAGAAPVELEGLSLPAGSGPRHFVFHPRDAGQLYLLGEQANALDWLGLDASGRLVHRLRLSSLPAGFEGLNYASDLRIAPDGSRLFALNRLHDAIAVFDLDAQGRPSWRGEVWAQGSYPRSATLSPDGRQLWVCLQRSHQICVFELERGGVGGSAGSGGADGGLPRFDGQFIAMPGAACVVFR